MEFFATMPQGIEKIAAKELEELGGKVTEVRSGRVFFKGRKFLVYKLNFFSRCCERILILLERGKFQKLEDIYSRVRKIDFSFLEGKSFAVRSLRVGEHDFTSLDVADVGGRAIIESFMDSHGERLKVNLNEPEAIIRIDVVNKEFFVGLDTTGDDALHKRWWRVYNHPAHLNSTIACAMIKLSGWNEKKSLLDPMCGSGTIPIEAALIGRRIPPGKNRSFAYFKLFGERAPSFRENKKSLSLTGIEKFEKHLKGAVENARNAGVEDTIKFRLGDATAIEGSYDCIVTNPPYGLRIGSKRIVKKLYEKFVQRVAECMHTESKFVIITPEEKILTRATKMAGLKIKEKMNVMYGGLRVKIFKISKS